MKHREEIYCVQRKDYRKLIMGPLIPWYQTDQMNAKGPKHPFKYTSEWMDKFLLEGYSMNTFSNPLLNTKRYMAC